MSGRFCFAAAAAAGASSSSSSFKTFAVWAVFEGGSRVPARNERRNIADDEE